MSKFGIVTFSSPGHLNPSLTLARCLRDRGHEISFYTLVNAQPKIEAAEFKSNPYGKSNFDTTAIEESYRQLGQLTGMKAVRFLVGLLKRRAKAALLDLPRLFAEDEVEGLLVDQVETAGAAVARFSAIPFVTVCNALPLQTDPHTPPVFSNIRPTNSLPNRLAVKMLNFIQSRLELPVLRELNDFQRSKALPLFGKSNQVMSELAFIAQLPATLDFPRKHLQDNFHYTGPFHSSETRQEISFPWDKIDSEKPLIYASMGTLQNQIPRVFQMISEACVHLDAQLVISLGKSDSSTSELRLAGNPIVVDYAPQLELLKRASLCITHAGLNTALESLSHGVPMLAIPITNDQPGVAARVAHYDLGKVIPIEKVTAAGVRTMVEAILHDQRFVRNAKSMQTTIAGLRGPERACDIIEQALISKRPVLREDHPRA